MIFRDYFLTDHFLASEFRCKCKRSECDAKPMLSTFMRKLEALRVEWNKPLVPTSGSRCAFWNEHEGGAEKGQHVLGNAVDFNFKVPSQIILFVALAEKYGFGGIGVGRRLVHLDDRGHRARWTYP